MRQAGQQSIRKTGGTDGWRSLALSFPARMALDLHPVKTSLWPFEFWKLCLREDCARQGYCLAFERFDDGCLRLLWETGALPCVLDIIPVEKIVN